MSKEAMKLALKFIWRVNKDGWILADFEPEMYLVIKALEEALDKQEQGGCAECGIGNGHALYCVRCAEEFVGGYKENVPVHTSELLTQVSTDTQYAGNGTAGIQNETKPTGYFFQMPKQKQGEPVAWRNAAIRVGEDLCSVGPHGYYDMTAEQWLDWALSVVTVHLSPQPAQNPLTDEEIVAIYHKHYNIDYRDFDADIAIARAIEAAHGIKE